MKQVKLTNITTGEIYYKVCSKIEAHHILVKFRKAYRGCDWFEIDERFSLNIRKGSVRTVFVHNLSRQQTIRMLEISNIKMPVNAKKAA